MILPLSILAAALAFGGAAAMPDGPRGQDPFDTVETLDELRILEGEVRALAERLRPTVVLLKLGSRFGGATGTGVVISSDGLVATCGHVGERAGRKVTATLSDGTVLTGRTLGQANIGVLDCGLVQLDTEGRDLPSAPLGTDAGLEQGDWLVSMGFTQGIPERTRPALVRVGRVLRINSEELLFDAPIDAGDSGGPSFNLRGEVVGINSRCGRQPWENVATPVDRLRERVVDFREGTDESMTRIDLGDEAAVSIRTDFTRGRSEDGRMAVQRSLPLDDIVGAARASMVAIMEGRTARCYGTAIDSAGHVVTKASQLPAGADESGVAIETADGTACRATVVGRDGQLDLAVLQLAGCAVPPIKWKMNARIGPGEVLLSPRLGRMAPALGFAAIERRESEKDIQSGPYLGVGTDSATAAECARAGVKAALRVEEVSEGSGAAAAGIAVGDLILKLDGQTMGDRFQLRQTIMRRAVGERVRIELLRGDERRELDATLARRPPMPLPASRKGRPRGNTMTPISDVSTGFGDVLAHDAIVWPEQCGGPVVDLDGHVVGLNIARFDRTATHALEAKAVAKAAEAIVAGRR